MSSDDTMRDELRGLALHVVGSPVPDTERILRRARHLRRRRAATGVAVAVCLAAVVGAGLSGRTLGAHPHPGPIATGTPSPSATPSPTGSASPAADVARVAWVADQQVPGHPPSQVLFVDEGAGAQRVRTVENALVIPGGFLDGGRTVVWAEGNGEPGLFAQSLSAQGKPVGNPRPLLPGRLLGTQAILPVPTGGIALRVLPKDLTSPDHLVFLDDAETVRSDVAVDAGPFTLLTADARGVIAAFAQPGGGQVVRRVDWQGVTSVPMATIDGCSSGSGTVRPVPPVTVLAAEHESARLALAVGPCDSATAAGRASAYVLVVSGLDVAGMTGPFAEPVRLRGWTGLVTSLWWDAAGTLHVHTFSTITMTSVGQTVADPRSYGWSGTGQTMTPDGLDDVVERIAQASAGQVLEVTLRDSGPHLVFALPVRATLTLPGGGARSVATGSVSQFLVD